MPTQRNIDLYKDLGLDEKAQAKRAKRIAAAMWARWSGMVNSLSSRYRQSYRNAMRMQVRGSHIVFELEGDTLARSVEYGFGPGGVGTQGPYDMRRTLLRAGARGVRRSLRGSRYLHVPMGMSTRKMRSMPGGERAYRMARQLAATVSRGPGRMIGGSLPRGLTPKLRPQGRNVPGIGYHPPHATDPTHGVRRNVGSHRGSRYGTFRTITSDGKVWVHPGIKARRFMRRMAGQVAAVVKEVG